MNHDAPVFRRAEDGKLTVDWPDPPADYYPVDVRIIQQMTDAHNKLVDARAEIDELRTANEKLRRVLYGTDDRLDIHPYGISRR